MRQRDGTRPWLLLLLAVATMIGGISVGPAPARAERTGPPVTDWIARTAEPLATVDPDAAPTDLATLRRALGNATVVGLGESTHGAREQILLKHRVLRLLVESGAFVRSPGRTTGRSDWRSTGTSSPVRVN